MHYYKRCIGDYARKAGRLTMLQHGAYTLLLDACYDREIFPSRTEAMDWCWASSPEEIAAVDFVLAKFFTLVSGQYEQKRVLEDLGKYHATAITNKRIADERETKRKKALADTKQTVDESSTKRVPTDDEAPPNHKPLTTNQEPLTINQEQNTHPPTQPTIAAAVCVALRAEGMGSVNPSNVQLLRLLQDGAQIQEFVEAGRIAKEKGKGFAYCLGIVEAQQKAVKQLLSEASKKRIEKQSRHNGLDQINYREGVNADGAIQ
jgi:uncharacterized protein YdaU (DUF1376 family)